MSTAAQRSLMQCLQGKHGAGNTATDTTFSTNKYIFKFMKKFLELWCQSTLPGFDVGPLLESMWFFSVTSTHSWDFTQDNRTAGHAAVLEVKVLIRVEIKSRSKAPVN